MKYILIAFALMAFSSQAQNKGVTFKVDDVELAKHLLKDTSYQLVLGQSIEKEVFSYPEDEKKDQGLIPIHNNGLIRTIHLAYSEHRPLELTPDVIWFQLCHGLAIHISENHEEFKDELYTNSEPILIYERNDDLVTGAGSEWADLVNQFSTKANDYIKSDLYDLAVPEFTTTTPVMVTAYQANLLRAVEKNFFLMGASGCGIPSITLLGERKDWQKIYDDVDGFKEYGLGYWVDEIKPILKEFLNAYDGKEDREFWKGMYKDFTMYGKFNVTGWFTKLYPYLKTIEWPEDYEEEPYVVYKKNEYLKGYEYQLASFTTQSFPHGYSLVDFKWRVFDETGQFVDHDMELYGGFLGMVQNEKTMAIRPELTWAVCKEDADYPDYWGGYHREREKHEHDKVAFEPRPMKEVDSLPIYHPAINDSYTSGILEIRKMLNSTGIDAEGTAIDFHITWEGRLIKVEINNDTLSETKKKHLERLLYSLPNDWKPAVKMMRNYDRRAQLEPFRVNFRVQMVL